MSSSPRADSRDPGRFRLEISGPFLLATAAVAFLLALLVLKEVLSPSRSIRAEPSREAQLAEDLERLFANVAETVKLSVVSIGTTDAPSASDPTEGEAAPSTTLESIGSGFIIDPRGYILTNHHLIADATRINVHLHDNRELPAKVITSDSPSDVALLKIDAEGLHSLPMTSSRNLRVGQWVLAIGSPFGLTQTVSAGIISALGRSDLRILPFENFIQTDASINPGNSGGPLVNLRGEAIGINTAMYSNPGGGGQGIGFAVPIDLASALAQRWIEGKRECYLGVHPSHVDQEMARYFGLTEPQGAFVDRVNPDSPASRAGLQAKDLLVTFAGTPVRDENHLRVLIASTPPQQPVEVEVLRQDHRERMSVLLEEKAGPPVVIPEATPRGEGKGTRLLGITVAPLDPQIAEQLGLLVDCCGMAILDVQPSSPASKKGLRQGDVIVEINERPVRKVADMQEVLKASKNVVMLGVLRSTGEVKYCFLSR